MVRVSEVQNSTLFQAACPDALLQKGREVLEKVKQKNAFYPDSTGWMDVASRCTESWLEPILARADYIRRQADAFVLVGVGGSNNAARAVIEAMPQRCDREVIYAGNTMSAWEMERVLAKLKNRSVHINVIAKNFETMEPGVAFRRLRRFLTEVYGEAANDHVTVTGTEGSHLHDLCRTHGYAFLSFPKNIGGRFSAISEVGLLPMAVAGLDVRALLKGAMAEEAALMAEDAAENRALRYALDRYRMYLDGRRVELLAFFEPRFSCFARWWAQLFGESEGKQDTGMYPAFVSYTEDLHSVGQFIQEGSGILAETFLLTTETPPSSPLTPDQVEDRFSYLDDADFAAINQVACAATQKAHGQRLPCAELTVGALNEETFGQLFYFFEFACYCSARLLDVDPFDQPGVEAYKNHMFQALGKP